VRLVRPWLLDSALLPSSVPPEPTPNRHGQARFLRAPGGKRGGALSAPSRWFGLVAKATPALDLRVALSKFARKFDQRKSLTIKHKFGKRLLFQGRRKGPGQEASENEREGAGGVEGPNVQVRDEEVS